MRQRFELLLQDPENDAVLVMNVPTALASSEEAARTVAEIAREHRSGTHRPKPVFAIWAGGSDRVTPIFEAAGIPSYPTETDAVRGFMHLVRYREALDTPDGNAAEPAGRFQTRHRGGAREPRGGAAERPHLARSDRDHGAARGL